LHALFRPARRTGGRSYHYVCQAATDAGFRAGHELGRAEHVRRTRVRELDRELDHRTRRIAALRKAWRAPDADTALREDLRENEAEAVRWYWRAAEAGEKTAMMMLGWHYQNGRSVSQDTAQAIRWYRRAAELGNAQGALRLARFLAQGHGGADGRAEATRWYRVAAEAGAPAALAELGFRLGRAAEPDPDSAADWLLRARAADDDRIPPFIADNLDRLPEATLRALQHRLSETGEYDGALDGQASPALQAAISSP
jgi:TPR repeat protein